MRFPDKLFFAMLMMGAGGAQALAQSGASAGAPSFDVASIKAAKADEIGEDREDIRTSPGSLTMRHVSVGSCIKWAYGLNVSEAGRLPSGKFDIVARAAGPAGEDQLRLMLQTLLAARFKLVLHRDRKEAEVYVLVVGKGGPKFREATGEGADSMTPGRFGFTARRTSMPQLTEYLAIALRRPVLDQTGLSGRYDFAVDLTVYAGGNTQPDDIGAMVLTAVQEQLGLKLEPRKGPVEILVIDHIEKAPTEND